MTFPKDRAWALAGLEYRLARVYPSFIIYGIVSTMLNETLLWKRAELEPMHRIDFSNPSGGPSDVSPPSWSWMAYTGAIDYVRISASTKYLSVRFEFSAETHQCVLLCQLWKIDTTLVDTLNNVGISFDDNRDKSDYGDILNFVPLMKNNHRTYGLLVEARDEEYVRIGVASFPTCEHDRIDNVRVI